MAKYFYSNGDFTKILSQLTPTLEFVSSYEEDGSLRDKMDFLVTEYKDAAYTALLALHALGHVDMKVYEIDPSEEALSPPSLTDR